MPTFDKTHFEYDHQQRLQVTLPEKKQIMIDFLSGKVNHRWRYGGGKNQLLAKACGLKNQKNQKEPLSILDATAGFGEDGVILASLGCQMTLLERSPIIARLLIDATNRLLQQEPSMQITVIAIDAFTHIKTLKPSMLPDIIYLDPMFPERKKSALVKAPMRLLKTIVGEDQDADQLLPLAMQFAKKRVVVKRPKLAPQLNQASPNITYTGKSCRFDVYLI